MEPILLYDTTLRDGTQGENITFSADEKIKIALRLDDFGIHYIEGGWPGSNPKDMQFFDLAKRVEFRQARLVAFGSTRKPGIQPDEDEQPESADHQQDTDGCHFRQILGSACAKGHEYQFGRKPCHDP